MSLSRLPVLTIARTALRVLVLLNALLGLGILALLATAFADPAWTMRALGMADLPDTTGALTGMRAIAACGVVGALLNGAVLQRLLAMVETTRRGDPFVSANAGRLEAIAWLLLGLQLLALAIGLVARAISTHAHPFHVDAGFSVSGWLAVILTFVLARVYAAGTAMREELEGTV